MCWWNNVSPANSASGRSYYQRLATGAFMQEGGARHARAARCRYQFRAARSQQAQAQRLRTARLYKTNIQLPPVTAVVFPTQRLVTGDGRIYAGRGSKARPSSAMPLSVSGCQESASAGVKIAHCAALQDQYPTVASYSGSVSSAAPARRAVIGRMLALAT